MEHSLENQYLRVSVSTQGGRIGSLVSLETDTEFLLQSHSLRSSVVPGLHASFHDGPCAGVDECLPSVGASPAETQGGPVPDHGDFWQVPWHTQEPTQNDALRLSATGFSRPLRFYRHFRLDGRSLVVRYTIRKSGTEDTSFVYACHPLFAVQPGDRICLPACLSTLRLHSSRTQRLSATGDLVSWPNDAAGTDLSVALESTSGVADMLYTDRLRQGWCGIYRAQPQQGISMHFDAALLPFLGLWLCYGGWPEPEVHAGSPRQYAVALEPTTAPHATLDEAQRAGMARSLGPGESFQWTIRFTLSAPGIRHADFQREEVLA